MAPNLLTSKRHALLFPLFALTLLATSSFVHLTDSQGSVKAQDLAGYEAEKNDLRRDIREKAEPETRIKAAKKLASFDVHDGCDLILKAFDIKKLLKDPKGRDVIDAFAEALGRFRNKESVTAIAKELLSKDMAKPENMYTSYLVLKGMAFKSNEDSRAVVREALWNTMKEPHWLQMAALEAIGDSHDQVYISMIREFLAITRPEWSTELSIVPVSALDTLSRIYVANKDSEPTTIALLDEIVQHMARDWTSIENVRAAAGICFARIAELKGATTSISWLSSYLANRKKDMRDKDGKILEPSQKERNTDVAGPKFVGMQALNRIIYCIDISDSMNDEVSDAIIEERKKKDPVVTGESGKEDEKEKKKGHRERIDWDSIKTKMDLAKADLVLSLSDIPVGDKKTKYYFNIVTYSTTSQLIDEDEGGFIEATEASISRMIEKVKELSTDKMTNIHGALLDAYRVTTKGRIAEDVNASVHPDGILYGANTIFFLTDGWGSWSDDSTDGNMVSDKRRKDTTPVVGDGQFIYGPDILADFVRLNKFRKCIVNCVGIGNHDKELMRGMAAKSGGEYIDLSGNKRK